MSGKLKVAIAGCGGIGNWHLSRIKDFEDIELVGFYDIISSKAEQMVVTAGNKGKAFDCYIKMLDEAKPDAIYIGVPPDQHGMLELEAIKRGIHMLVQKPIANDIAVAEKVCDKITQHNIITSVGFQDRYMDIIDPMKEFLDGREIGLISGAWVGGIPGVFWWRRRSMSGGQIVEQNIHLFDMLRYLIGEPLSLYTAAGKGIVKPFSTNLTGYDVEDYTSTVVTFRNGSIANLFTGDYVTEGGGMKLGLTFYAKNATVDYVLRNKVSLIIDGEVKKEVIKQEDQGMALDRVFIDAVKSGDPSKIRSPYFDGIKSLKFALATNTSIDTGKAVYLNL